MNSVAESSLLISPRRIGLPERTLLRPSSSWYICDARERKVSAKEAFNIHPTLIAWFKSFPSNFELLTGGRTRRVQTVRSLPGGEQQLARAVSIKSRGGRQQTRFIIFLYGWQGLGVPLNTKLARVKARKRHFWSLGTLSTVFPCFLSLLRLAPAELPARLSRSCFLSWFPRLGSMVPAPLTPSLLLKFHFPHRRTSFSLSLYTSARLGRWLYLRLEPLMRNGLKIVASRCGCNFGFIRKDWIQRSEDLRVVWRRCTSSLRINLDLV